MATARDEFNVWWDDFQVPPMANRKQLAELAWHASALRTCDTITKATPGAEGQDSTATDGKDTVGTDKEATQQS